MVNANKLKRLRQQFFIAEIKRIEEKIYATNNSGNNRLLYSFGCNQEMQDQIIKHLVENDYTIRHDDRWSSDIYIEWE